MSWFTEGRLPFEKKKVKESDPYEDMSPEEQWAYVEARKAEAESWRRARVSPGIAGQRVHPEPTSIGDLGVRYAFEDFKGAYREFLEEFTEADSQDDRVKVFNKHLKSMMAKGWTRKGATKRLLEKLIEHGLINPEELGLEEV